MNTKIENMIKEYNQKIISAEVKIDGLKKDRTMIRNLNKEDYQELPEFVEASERIIAQNALKQAYFQIVKELEDLL